MGAGIGMIKCEGLIEKDRVRVGGSSPGSVKLRRRTLEGASYKGLGSGIWTDPPTGKGVNGIGVGLSVNVG